MSLKMFLYTKLFDLMYTQKRYRKLKSNLGGELETLLDVQGKSKIRKIETRNSFGQIQSDRNIEQDPNTWQNFTAFIFQLALFEPLRHPKTLHVRLSFVIMA